jgi:hypothetical protein
VPWPWEKEVRCRCSADVHHVDAGRVVLRTASVDDVPALLSAVDAAVAAANGWKDDRDWLERRLAANVGRRTKGHDFVEHLLIEVKGHAVGVRSVYKRGDRLVTHGWMRASNWKDHDVELDAVTRFAHFHLGFPVVFSMASREDVEDRELLAEHGYKGPHRAEKGVQLASGDVAGLDIYIHRERDARHTCTALAGPSGVLSTPATVQPAAPASSSVEEE